MNIIELEETLRKNIQTAKADGWMLVTKQFGNPKDKTCCAVTANGFTSPSDEISFELFEIMWGFDNLDEDDEVNIGSPYYQLGARLRKEFLPTGEAES